jgi:hypothetical protein
MATPGPALVEPSDTDSEAERVLVELSRRATPARKWRLLTSWSKALVLANLATLRRLHPGATDEEIGLLFVAHHHGQELADGLRAHLAARRR